MQPAFACQLLRALKERGVSTAIETNFSFPFEEVIGPLLPWTDLWMVDIKLFDAQAHKRWTAGTTPASMRTCAAWRPWPGR